MNGQNDKVYTAEDIIRYHSGKMPEGEMHAMEKAALEDPLLADALEGYLNTSTPNEDLAEIGERLSEKRKTKVIPVMRPYEMWLKIAAVLILVVGAGYMTYYFNSGKQEKALARVEDSSNIDKRSFIKQGDTTKALSDKGSLAKIDTIVSGRQQLRHMETTKTKTTISSAISVPDTTKQNEISTGKDIAKTDNIISAPISQEKQLSGKVVDSTGQPVAYANIKDNKNRTTATDKEGNFTVKSHDTTMTVNIAAVGYNTRRAKLKNGKTIVMQPKQKYKEIVAVTDAKKKERKNDDDDSVLVLKKAAEKKAIDDLPRVIGIDSLFQPVKGWMDFNEYMTDNRDLFDKCKGQMVLSFITDKKGYPIKINVEKSLSYECDEKAIKLLRDGPKWRSVPNKRCNITLQF